MTTHVAVGNLKGGTGKTTTAVSLAHGLVLAGATVLLADTDRQGQDATCLGLMPSPGLSAWLGPTLYGQPGDVTPHIIPSGIERLDLLPGDSRTELLQRNLGNAELPGDHLARVVAEDPGFDGYDYVIWDTAAYGRLLDMVLVHADLVIAPAALAFLGLEGVSNFAQLLTMRNPNALLRILPTRFDRRTTIATESLAMLSDHFGDVLATDLDGVIAVPERTSIEQAQAEGKTIFQHKMSCESAGAYERLAQLVVRLAGAQHSGPFDMLGEEAVPHA